MNNKLILSCLFLASFISASKPLPAAGAGLSSPVAPAQAAAVGQSQAVQIDVKHLQEKHEKYERNRKALAQLVAEMHQTCGSVRQRKELLEGYKSALLGHTNNGWLLRYSIPTAKDEWIDKQTITMKNSSTLTITTHYSLDVPVSSKIVDAQGNDFQKLIRCKKSTFCYDFKGCKNYEDMVHIFGTLMNNRIESILNVLSTSGHWEALKTIINNGAFVPVDL